MGKVKNYPAPAEMRSFITSNVKVNAETGCWIWLLGSNKTGYGFCKGELAHRASYMAFVGDIPEGLTLDHLCRVRLCCNHEHLEPVTLAENVLRGTSPPAQNRRKLECPQGHPYSANGKGERFCVECKRASENRRYHLKKSEYQARTLAYRLKNKIAIAAKNKAYYEANRLAIREKQNAAKRAKAKT